MNLRNRRNLKNLTKVRVVVMVCSLVMATIGNNLFAQAQEEEKFGDERIENLIEKYTAQTIENKDKYQSLSSRWAKNDSMLTEQDITFLRCYYTTTPEYNPLEIDEFGEKIYKLNEDGKYEEAIELSKQLEKICPFNLISLKETAYALSKLEKEHTAIWDKTLQVAQAMYTYGENFEPKDQNVVRTLNIPIFPLSLYEGAILYDMSVSFPKRMEVTQFDEEQTAVFYSAHDSGKWAFLSSQWGYFNHAKRFYEQNKQTTD